MELQSLQPEIEKLKKDISKSRQLHNLECLVNSGCAGQYTLDEKRFRFSLKNKPSWLKRTCMSIFFGFKWVDA